MVNLENTGKIISIFTITLRLIMYIILFVAFIIFFLKDQLEAYISGRTTITSKVEVASTLEFPTVTLCMQPGTKKSVQQKYNLTDPSMGYHVDVPNMTIGEVMEEQSYILNQDLHLKINDALTQLGLNNHSYIDTVVTSKKGICYKISVLHEITSSMIPYYLDLQVILDSKLNEKPEKVLLYLTSNNTWNGIANSWWPQYKPSMIGIEFKYSASFDFEEKSVISIKPIEHHFREGSEDMGKCATNVLGQTCNKLCKVISTINAPFCNTTEEYQCAWKAWQQNMKEYIDCFKTQKALTVDMREEIFLVTNKDKVDLTKATLRLKLESMTKEIRDETRIVTTPDLIGSVGGSLGMFFGFTLAPNIDIIIEKGKRWVLNRLQIQRRSGT